MKPGVMGREIFLKSMIIKDSGHWAPPISPVDVGLSETTHPAALPTPTHR